MSRQPDTPATVTVRTSAPDETRSLGSALAAVARPGDRIGLFGELGAGKTRLAQGFARGLGIREIVNSPSFTLMAEYEGRLPLFHIDLYRLAGAESALAGGLLDERQAVGVTLWEWADRWGDAIDRDRVEVRISIGEDEERTFEVRAPSDRYTRYLDAAARWQPGS